MQEMSRDNAEKVDLYFSKLDECVKALLKYKRQGKSVYTEFKGHKLYSCDVTMDGAYQEVTGYKSKAECDKIKQELIKKIEKQDKKELTKKINEEDKNEKMEASEKIPYWIRRGQKFIYTERGEEWERYVKTRAKGIYNGMDLDAVLELMEGLENGEPIEKVKETFYNQNHSGSSEVLVRNAIFKFSKRGPEFYESTATEKISEGDQEVIENKKRENAELENLHKADISAKQNEVGYNER